MTKSAERSIDPAPRRLAGVAVLIAAIAALLIVSLAPSHASASTKWLCKPGTKPDPCKGSLETTVFKSDGSSSVKTAENARKPKYDCFYVYPTVSEQPTPNATKDIDPQQTAIAQYQAARYSEDCKVYAPVYRQATLAAIGDPDNVDLDTFTKAYGDVLKAWKNYLRNYNKGRGVVLIGHSQGTGMLNTLLSTEIEKRKSQRKRLISAILLGGNVTVRKGKDHGGTFKKTPLCSSEKQTGCVIAFSTFNETPPPGALFGRTDGPFAAVPEGKDPADYKVACTNPASLGGGSGRVRTIARSEPFPGTLGIGITIMYGGPQPTADTPWLTPEDRYTAKCDYTDGASSLLISPIGEAKTLNPSPDATWGLHLLDANVALGNLVDIVHTQGKRYLKKH
jgi:Protein of unknown function (DUF3089)